MSKKPMAWSWSALNSFETCPKRHYETKVAKNFIEPETEHTRWGNAVHKAFDKYLSEGKELPDSMKSYKPVLDKIKEKSYNGTKLSTEQKITLTEKMRNSEWFARDAWCRSIIDVILENNNQAFVADWKTGKKKDESQQLKLFAAVLFTSKPWLESVTTSFIWLQEPEDSPSRYTIERFTRDQLPELWNEFLPRVARMKAAYDIDSWPEKPSGLCRKWCPVETCLHNGKFKG